jgi:hypothetical protein
MNEKQAAEIDALMTQHDTRTGKRGDDRRAEEEFAVSFGRLRDDVIKPAMERVAEKLTAGGHHAGITEAHLTANHTGKDQPGAIRMEILPAGTKRERYEKNGLPGVTFSVEPGMKVGVYSRSGRPDEDQESGPQRRFQLSEVTPDMVTTEIVAVMRKTF